jgi:Ribbon-helix-helix protein, copG family
MRKERTNIYLTPRQKQQLEKRSLEDGLSMAEIIRRALDAFLAWDDPTYTPSSQAPDKEGPVHPPHE